MNRIFVIGSSNTDMVVKSSRLPSPGETILGGSFLMNAGGKGANQAVAAAKLGAPVVFGCKIGNDVFGQEALRNFQQEGINTDFVVIDQTNPTGVALILVDEKGENCIAVASGANANFSPPELDKIIDEIEPGDIVLVQLEIPVPSVEYAIKRCNEKGAQVILNPAPAQVLNENLFPFIHLITPNETEAGLLTGVSVTDLPSAEKAAEVLHNKGVPNVVITLGAKGAYISTVSLKLLVPSPVVNAIDTTAAGDVFNGALAVALAEGQSLEQAVRFACSAAAVSVTRMGAQSSAPSRHELQLN